LTNLDIQNMPLILKQLQPLVYREQHKKIWTNSSKIEPFRAFLERPSKLSLFSLFGLKSYTKFQTKSFFRPKMVISTLSQKML